jgi:hypothetical protein
MRSLRQARNARTAAHAPAPAWAGTSAITLRIATPQDDSRIARLAALDSSRPPAPPVLTAELDGEICVAVSLTDLRTVADPFRFTLPVRAITLARADQLRGAAPPRRRRLGLFGIRRRTADRSPRPQGAI